MPDTETELNSAQMAQDVQNELMDMIIADESPATISDKIKDILFAKSSEKVDAFRPEVATATFGNEEESQAQVDDAIATASARISGEDQNQPAEE